MQLLIRRICIEYSLDTCLSSKWFTFIHVQYTPSERDVDSHKNGVRWSGGLCHINVTKISHALQLLFSTFCLLRNHDHHNVRWDYMKYQGFYYTQYRWSIILVNKMATKNCFAVFAFTMAQDPSHRGSKIPTFRLKEGTVLMAWYRGMNWRFWGFNMSPFE